MDNEEFKLIYNKALDLISRREHSKYELFLKVKRKFPDRINVIDNALTSLNSMDLSTIEGLLKCISCIEQIKVLVQKR